MTDWKLPAGDVVRAVFAPLVAWGRHPFAPDDGGLDLDGVRCIKVGTRLNENGDPVTVWAVLGRRGIDY